MENNYFTWIPFYTELAKKLLSCKNDRKSLVDWIYAELSKVGEKSLVNYLKMEDKSPIKDIDPFSVFAIFNRNLKWVNKIAFLQKFKEKFNIESEIPDDFEGIPTVNSQKAFFFNWTYEKNYTSVQAMWDLFEDVVLERDFSKSFDVVLANKMAKISLTMVLFWISPYKFVALDQRNKGYLEKRGVHINFSDFNYNTYMAMLEEIKALMNEGKIPCKTFPDLSYTSWRLSQTKEETNKPATAETMPTNKYSKYIELLKEAHNLVLTGAPGTGKTFMAQEIAKEMLNLDSIEDLKNDKRFSFVQFHPSYDYTDFVEGLRPKKETQNGVIGFERRDGIFKEFCKNAILSESTNIDILADINNNPTVWKVSLEGTGDNPTRTDCMNNDYIRIGWKDYGDVEDFYDYNDFYDGGKNVLRAFQSGMKIGDIVVSCYSAKEIDAVGIITGDYEYHAEGGEYPRYRNVRWLVKNIRENIVEKNNNKTFTLPTVYKANITADAALKIVNEHSANLVKNHKIEPVVFVIDEINRGEISKIFGELFFSIDPGYRGGKGIVKTQYQNIIEDGDVFKEGFFVPENVYILATMNDIDRSVESMDFAMRRRFTWKEIKPADTDSMLDTLDCSEDAKAAMNRLNKAITETDGLGAAYMVGPSYFLKLGENGGDFNRLWEMNIAPLLREYLRGFRKVEDTMKKFEDAYFNKEKAESEAEAKS